MNLISYNVSFVLMNLISCFLGQWALGYFFHTYFDFWDIFFPILFGNYLFVAYNSVSHNLGWIKLGPDMMLVLGAACVWFICWWWYGYSLKSSGYVLGVHFIGNTIYNVLVSLIN